MKVNVRQKQEVGNHDDIIYGLPEIFTISETVIFQRRSGILKFQNALFITDSN